MKRSDFLKIGGLAGLGYLTSCQDDEAKDSTPDAAPPFEISLAEWSLNRMIRKGDLSNLKFPAFAKKEFGIDAVEYVNQLFPEEKPTAAYVSQLKQRCEDEGVKSLLIMIDRCGAVGLASPNARQETVEKHKIWLEIAKELGCHSVRVNAHGEGENDEERAKNCSLGLGALCDVAADFDLNVLVENHGGLSSNGAWLSKVLRETERENVGSLPDFGNFLINHLTGESYDRYRGMEELMPLAKAVSAKSRSFDAEGNETETDYARVMEIVLRHGYRGYVGIEYEGKVLSEVDGIRATQRLLESLRQKA